MHPTTVFAALAASLTVGYSMYPVAQSEAAQRAWIDVDGDGDLDLFVANPEGPDKYFRRVAGELVDATVDVGLDRSDFHLTAWEDFDGDGDVDLFGIGPSGSALLEFADGHFIDVTEQLGLAHNGRDLDAAWSDPNGDGLADLEIAQRGRTLLYTNRGGRAFAATELEVPAVVPTRGTQPTGRSVEDEESARAGTPGQSVVSTRERRAGSGASRRAVVRPPAAPLSGSSGFVGSPPSAAFSSACSNLITDQFTGVCIAASSDPTLGALMPLSQDFNIDASGEVGMGTNSPDADLHVSGGTGSVELLLEADTNNVGEANHPSITMSQDGGGVVGRFGFFDSSNAFTMTHETGGASLYIQNDDGALTYRDDVADQVRAVVDSTASGGRMRLFGTDNSTKAFFDVSANGGRGTYEAANGTNNVVINGEFANGGGAIRVRNGATSGDRILLQGDNGNNDGLIDLTGRLHVTSSNNTTFGPLAEVEHTSSTTGPAVLVNFERGQTQTANDLLQLQGGAGSSNAAQFIEAEVGANCKFRVDMDGDVFTDGAYLGPCDFAEMIEVSTGAETVEPGDVVIIDPSAPRAVRMSSAARSTLVAGIYSTRPGFVGTDREWDRYLGPDQEPEPLKGADMADLYDEVPIAVVGIVPCKVSAENGPIAMGDLLVTSDTPGHAMRDANPQTGTVVGKALGSLGSGTGVIKVLVTLH